MLKICDKTRFDKIFKYIDFNKSIIDLKNYNFFENKKVLSLGCGIGLKEIELYDKLYLKSITGIDIDVKAITLANLEKLKIENRYKNINFLVKNFEIINPSFLDKFDCAIMIPGPIDSFYFFPLFCKLFIKYLSDKSKKVFLHITNNTYYQFNYLYDYNPIEGDNYGIENDKKLIYSFLPVEDWKNSIYTYYNDIFDIEDIDNWLVISNTKNEFLIQKMNEYYEKHIN